jgi:putative transposase
VTQGKLHIPKFREGISMVEHRALTGTIRNATVSKTAGGKYYVSIVALTEEKLKEPLPFRPETTTGIDLGIKSFAVLSDGSQYDSPKPLKQSLAKLKVLQRRLAKKRKGSSNRKKAAGRVALLHEHIANQRKDFLHKLSNVITKRYDTLCVEDLAIMNMTKNHQLAGSISDAGWGMFLTFVKYKSAWRGKRVVEIGRFEPSSKRHYGCGKKYEGLTLGDREWTCPHCGERVLRDVNAALNIRAFGILKITGVECTVEPVELPALAGAMKQEKFAGRRLCLILSMPPSQKEVVHCPGITFP